MDLNGQTERQRTYEVTDRQMTHTQKNGEPMDELINKQMDRQTDRMIKDQTNRLLGWTQTDRQGLWANRETDNDLKTDN